MTTNTDATPDNCTVLPDGSAFATASYPVPKNHWLYAPREYEPGAEEPKELPPPILTHAFRAEVVAAVRYAIRGATMCGKEPDFDPDALVQNAVYALCGPFEKTAFPAAAQPARKRFFSYDDQGELELHATLELAEAAANAAFEYCADEARAEGWSECVEQICYGEIVGAVFETKREHWNEETLGSPPEPDVEHVEYAISRLLPSPPIDAAYEAGRASRGQAPATAAAAETPGTSPNAYAGDIKGE